MSTIHPDGRNETPTEIVDRLQRHWDHYTPGFAEVLMRGIACTGSGEAFYWTGIERDLAVYAIARVLRDASAHGQSEVK